MTLEQVRVSGTPAAGLRPTTSFSGLGLKDEKLLALIKGFTQPTPIQQWAWPALRKRHDLVGISETGSGKTLAFALPLLKRLLRKHRKSQEKEARRAGTESAATSTVRWLTIAPTRELAQQTYEVIRRALPCVCLYGGVPRSEQIRQLRELRPVAIVATPGRLQDLAEDARAGLDLSRVKYLVLDEADRMLDAGFEPAVSAIVGRLPPTSRRQTILFSATWPPSVQRLAARYMQSDFVSIAVGRGTGEPGGASSESPLPSNSVALEGGRLQANSNITQTVRVVEETEKDGLLLEALRSVPQQDTAKVIVFVLYKREAPRLEGLLRRNGLAHRTVALHGDMSQADRNAALSAFKAGSRNVLIATDVAARGLDIPDVQLVVNYTFPLTVEDYVHRIGRTGRGGRTGSALTLFTRGERALAGGLQAVLRASGQPVPEALAAMGGTTKKKVHSEYGAFYRDADSMAAATHVTFSDSE